MGKPSKDSKVLVSLRIERYRPTLPAIRMKNWQPISYSTRSAKTKMTQCKKPWQHHLEVQEPDKLKRNQHKPSRNHSLHKHNLLKPNQLKQRLNLNLQKLNQLRPSQFKTRQGKLTQPSHSQMPQPKTKAIMILATTTEEEVVTQMLAPAPVVQEATRSRSQPTSEDSN